MRATFALAIAAVILPAAAAGEPPAYIRFLTVARERRLLVVRIDRWSVPEDDRIPILAHELQHAVEIAAHPEVRDTRSMEALYRRIGWEARPGCFETDAARDVTPIVRRRLSGPQD